MNAVEQRTSTPADAHAVLAILSIAAFLTANGIGSINIALPAIQREFGVSLAEIQWIAVMGLVMLSTLALCWGRVGDMVGRRKLYRAGIVLYTVGSGLCAFSGTFLALVGSRMVMTAGLAMMVPLATAIIATSVPPERRGWALGIFVGASAAGRAAGPSIGGIIAFAWGWRAIFMTNLIFGALVCVAVFLIVRGRDERRSQPFDFLGATALFVGYPSLLIGLSVGTSSQWRSPVAAIGFMLFAVALVVFILAERRAVSPLVPLHFFKNLSFSAAVLATAIGAALHNPVSVFAPLFMTNVLQLTALNVGLIMSILPLSIALVSPLAGRLSDRIEPRYVATAGLAVALVGIALYARLSAGGPAVWVVASLLFLGVGVGLFTPANQSAAFASIDRGNYGPVSAMLTSFNTAAAFVGISALVTVVEGVQGVAATHDPLEFAAAQRFAFLFLIPLAAIGVLVSAVGGRSVPRRNSDG